ncbi:TetR/AcrR family transcriptional regulator [Mycobacterium hodleri]|uniref:TetR/AcrR family transcriptional regulator n=1 Tax=Mycolicibacterium hodleri TaxID=49897 RepID=UPI0021F35D1A|nr:TetR/AcrR family transcriptional regulator [Mycolicibacterium hodleri]MCV7133954.1 TetR/AcrR family transcriptional regulator [Mycolicibacterium hodleri]
MAESGRSDARRNRERLLQVAAAAYAAGDGVPSLEAIARSAGVGIGTLYRHFPTREALVEAVYRAELADVVAAAAALLQRHPPAVALRRWLGRYADFVAAKTGMAESLRAIVDNGTVQAGDTRANLTGAVETLLRAGAADGSLRTDIRPDDVVCSMVGIVLASSSTAQARRMFGLLVDGIVTKRD